MLAAVLQFMGTDVLRFTPVQLRFRQIARAVCVTVIFAALPSATVMAQRDINIAPVGEQPVPAVPQTPALTYPQPAMKSILDGGTKKVGRNEAVSEEQIQRWVRDLDADVFATRKLATAELAEVGKRMVPVLLHEMVDRGSLEQRHRGIQILETMATSKKIDDEAAAFDALRELAKQSQRSLHMRAIRTLKSIKVAYSSRAVQRLLAKGAILDRNFNGAAQNVNFIQGRVVPGTIVNSNRANRLVLNDRWEGKASDLEMLQFLTGIEQVELEGKKIDDSFLDAVSRNKLLRIIKIRKTNVTDQGIAKLEGLPELSYVDVRYTNITDESLKVLATLKLARYISLFGTGISHDKEVELNAKLPNAIVDIRRGGFLGARARQLGKSSPCIINRPEPGSAAERAGLIQDDIIITYDEKPVESFDELRDYIASNAPGDEVIVWILRANKKKKMTVTLGKWPDET